MNSDTPLKNKFTPYGLFLYFAVIILGLILYLTPIGKIVWNYFDSFGYISLYGHTSNFILSLTIVFAAGSIGLLYNVSWKKILFGALLLILANFITELYVTLSNTPDLIDAMFGTAGVSIALLLLLQMNRRGIRRDAVNKKDVN